MHLTRSEDDLVKALGMSGVSKSQVSRLYGELDEQVGAFLNRTIEGDWPYLWIDATYVKTREAGRIVMRGRNCGGRGQHRGPERGAGRQGGRQRSRALLDRVPAQPQPPWPARRQDASIIRLMGAMMLEHNDEWSLKRRNMTLEGLQSLSNTAPTRLPAVAG